MSQTLSIIQIIVSILLIACILLQARGSGLSAAFGGSGELYGTRRGIEKKIHIATIVLAIIFFGLGIARLLI